MKNYVYLIGPMEHCTEEEMTGWRIDSANFLDMHGIEVLDPTRRITFHDELTLAEKSYTHTRNSCNRIFKQDLQDVANSTVVLADMRDNGKRSIGSSMELMFAHMKNKIIILLTNEDDQIHPFLESVATEKHHDLYDALEAVTTYYEMN